MRALVIGLGLGLMAGLVAGVLLGRSALAPRDAPDPHAPLPVADAQHEPTSSRRRVDVARAETPPRTPTGSGGAADQVSPPAPVAPRDEWTAQGYLNALALSVDRPGSVDAAKLATELAERYPDTHISLDLARRLAAQQYFDVRPFVGRWTQGELVDALRTAAGASVDDRGLWSFCQVVAHDARRRGFEVDDQIVQELLAHELAFVREAGVLLSGTEDDVAVRALQQVAASDPNPGNRAEAVLRLVRADPTDEVRLRALRHAVLAAHPATREELGAALEDLGAAGADIALDALRDDGVVEESGLVRDLVAAVVGGGRAADLLARDLPDEMAAPFVEALLKLLADDPDALDVSDEQLRRLLRPLRKGEAERAYSHLIGLGRLELVAAEALRPTAHEFAREYAITALTDEVNDVPEALRLVASTLRRILWDADTTLYLRRKAWDGLMDLPGSAGFRLTDAERLLAQPESVSGGLRAYIVDELASSLDVADLKRLLPAMRALWRRVAADDPSAWVRATAQKRANDDWSWE